MQQLGSLQAFGVETTSLLSSDNFTGCRLRQRVNFKLAVLVYQALRNTTAQYLVEDCQLVSNAGRRRLRSADVDTCIVPLTRTRLGDRSFSVAVPRLWNSLQVELRQPDVEIGQFRRLLKTFLFAQDCDA